MNVVLSSPGIKAFIDLGPVHMSHFFRVTFNSIKCGRNATVDSYVALNSELILQCLSVRSKCDKGRVSNMADEDREGFSFCIRFNMAEMQRLNWCRISAKIMQQEQSNVWQKFSS